MQFVYYFYCNAKAISSFLDIPNNVGGSDTDENRLAFRWSQYLEVESVQISVYIIGSSNY